MSADVFWLVSEIEGALVFQDQDKYQKWIDEIDRLDADLKAKRQAKVSAQELIDRKKQQHAAWLKREIQLITNSIAEIYGVSRNARSWPTELKAKLKTEIVLIKSKSQRD